MAGIAHVITSDSASGSQVIDGSLKFVDGSSQQLTKTFSSAGNRRTNTFSCWIKKSGVQLENIFSASSGTGTNHNFMRFNSGKIEFYMNETSEGSKVPAVQHRDIGWYHLVFIIDTSNSTADDRMRIYVNNVRLAPPLTTFDTNNNPSENYQGYFGSNVKHTIGSKHNDSQYYDGQMSQVYFIDGQALEPENFGFTDPLTNTWKPKKYDTSTPSNNPNNGTTWSSNVSVSSGSFGSGEEATKGFDGNTGTKAKTTANGASITITFSGVTVERLLRIRTNYTNGTGSDVEVNDVSYGAAPTASDGEYKAISGFTGALTKIKLEAGGSVNAAFSAIEVDGVILQDSTTTNNRTWNSTVTFGANGFYLPLDGNSPIGQDQSGNGNDFTPVNFGGSVALDNPIVSGAKPILNTTQGGTQAGVGVFGSKQNVGYAVTVYNDGGGNKYYIDGVKQDTVTGLIRGATYTFDTSDSTVSSHPFRFSATSNGSHGGGSEYTNGVAAITGTATTITVPHDAPNTLYYYCTSHSGMGADITSITTNEKLADQYASHCVLALPLVGSKSDVSASIACTMTNKAVTSNANAAASNDQSNFYTGSFEFDGTGDNLSITASTDFAFEGGDYTIEWWQWWNAAPSDYASIFDVAYTDAASMVIQSNGTNAQWIVYVEGGAILTEATAAQFKKWTHYALVRNGTSVKLYRDGITSGSATNSGTSHGNGTHTAYVAGDEQGYEFNGYVQDFRIYKGVAKYTSEFVVPSRSPDILPDTPSGVAGGSKLTKIADGAVSFDGSGDYLTLAQSNDFDLTGDYTYEAFIYNTDTSGNPTIFDFSAAASNYEGRLQIQAGVLNIYDGGWQSRGAISANTWHHIAVTQAKVYVNGIDVGASSGAISGSNYKKPTIGARTNDGGSSFGDYFTGFISNVRIVNGTALYTSDFTPPTEPLTNVTNTKLLCCQSNTSASEAAVGGSTVAWLPTGYTYWTAGMSQNWAGSGGTTSNADDYINVALPTSGKYYWETTLNNIGTYRVMGISAGAAGAGSAYTNNIFGFYYNGNPPLFLTKNSSGTTRAASGVSHGASVGTPNWANGDKLMWAWDADNDKIYMGLNGTWYNSGDPAAGTGQIIDTEDLSASSFYFKLGYTADGGSLTLSNVTSGNSGSTTFPEVNGDAAATTFNPFITDINTVRGQESGYCTLNPLKKNSNVTLSDGNLSATSSGSHGNKYIVLGTTPFKVGGKFYFETQWMGSDYTFGIARDNVSMANDTNLGADANGYGYEGGGAKTFNSGAQASSFPATTAGDTFGIAVDLSGATGTVQWFKNGVLLNNGTVNAEFTGISLDDDLFPAVAPQTPNFVFPVNFGQKPFKFPPPDGFQPLNAANTRPVKVISRPDQFVGVVTYTGNNSARSITGYNFSPDLVFTKQRTNTGFPAWFDVLRGPTNALRSHSTGGTYTDSDLLTSFDSNGFSIGTAGDINSSNDYVGWCWKAGGNKNTFNVDDVGYASAAAAGLDGGSLSVTGASVGTKQGFSIIKFTGTGVAGSVSHGLTQKPDFIIAKNIDGTANNWGVHHSSLTGPTYTLYLDGTAGEGIETLIWPSASTDSLINVGSGALINENTKSTILYSWHDVPGLQKFGSYESNNSTDGPYIELGFRPALLWVKEYGANGQSWHIIDKERDVFNPVYRYLYTNAATAEGGSAAGTGVDFLSNGFKIRNNDNAYNNASSSFIYCAWAEAPSIDLYGGGANAR